MLTIVFGKCPGVIYNTPVYFDYKFKKEWLNNEFIKNMTKDIDRSNIIGDYIIESDVMGLIPPQMLSGGLKTLILIYYNDNIIFNGSQMGNNCSEWLLEIGKEKDITVWFGNIMNFKDNTFTVKVEWDNRTKNKIVTNMRDLINIATQDGVKQFYEDLD